MWLHIPESFPCVADTAGSTLPSSECFQALERSATSSGKFHASAYWRRAWQKGRLTRLRFGMMLPPSILNRGLEQWISSLRDSPASPIPSQASEKASMMTAGRSGMTSSGSRGAVQLELFSLKTSPGCSLARGGASIARVRADLDDAGFAHQRACIIAASDVGASHRRQRLFILAHRNDVGLEWIGVSWGGRDGSPHKGEGVVADIDSKRQSQRGGHDSDIRKRTGNERETVGDANCEGLERYGKQCELSAPRGQVAPCRSSYGLFAPGPDADWSAVHPRLWPATAQPSIRRMVDGTAGGLDITRAEKLHMLGNGVVPFQAAIALQALMESLEDV